jgi:predicted phosphodiesterase
VRFLILSDLHANLEALTAILADSEKKYDTVVCCGDLVGYNPDPSLIVDWCAGHCDHVVRGNHDKVVAGIDDLEWFNPTAQISARWTTGQLSQEQLRYLRDLPRGPVLLEHFELFHGTPFDEDEYVLSQKVAEQSLSALQMPLSFFGHTHIQGGFFRQHRRLGTIEAVQPDEREYAIQLEPDLLYMINPGSVGQPRDGDPRAAYALYDAEARLVTLRRVEYPIATTYRKLKSAGLPDALGLRLFNGQ